MAGRNWPGSTGNDGGQVGEQATEVLAERVHLALLALHGDDRRAAADLEVEDALAGRAFGGGGEGVDALERCARSSLGLDLLTTA